MVKLIQAGLMSLVLASVSVSAWAGPDEEFDRGEIAFRKHNHKEALKWYHKAALQEHAEASYAVR